MDVVTAVPKTVLGIVHSTVQKLATGRSNKHRWLQRICKRVIRGGELLGLGMLGVLACRGDTAGPNEPTSQALFFSFAFQWPAVNLALTAPYDTAQLAAIPRTASGMVLTDTSGVPAVVHYTTTDSAVQVSATGLVTAHSVTAGAQVIARLTIGGVTRTDTAIVQVTATPLPAPLASLSIHPQTGGLVEARGNLNVFDTPAVFPFSATMATGDPATDTLCTVMAGCQSPLLVHYASSDPTIGTIDRYGQLTLLRAGRLIITISTFAYGVHKVDSLPFSIGYYLREIKYFQIDSSQHPSVVSISGIHGRSHALYSVGMQLDVENYADEAYLITLPVPAHGVHFIDYTSHLPYPTQPIDTLPTCAEDCARNAVFVQFDSAGTYALQYRGVRTGMVYRDTLTILRYP